MKTLLFFSGMAMTLMGMAQSKKASDGERSEISKVVMDFALFGDEQNADTLDKILHAQHRLVLNDGTKEPAIMDKAFYLSKIRSKEWGGDKRKVTIESVQVIEGVNAVVTATLDGAQATMKSFYLLVKVNGEWKIIEDLVIARFK